MAQSQTSLKNTNSKGQQKNASSIAVTMKLLKNRLFFQCICNRNRSQLNDYVTFEMNVTFPKDQPFEFHHIKLSIFIHSIFKRELFFFVQIQPHRCGGKDFASLKICSNAYISAACIHSINSRLFFLQVNSRPLVSSIIIFCIFFVLVYKAKMAKILLPKM